MKDDMTSAEVGLIGTGLVTLFGSVGYLFKRQTNTYTKQETEEHIESKLAPIGVELQRHREERKEDKEARKENTKEMKALNESITELRIELASHKNV